MVSLGLRFEVLELIKSSKRGFLVRRSSEKIL